MSLLVDAVFCMFSAHLDGQVAALQASLTRGNDIIGAAETGSGKTLAFALPILQVMGQFSTTDTIRQNPADPSRQRNNTNTAKTARLASRFAFLCNVIFVAQ
jgi:superfamily II DNA/RNA helicase